MPLCVVEPKEREPAYVASKLCQLGDCEDGLAHVRHAIFCTQRVLVLLLLSLLSMLSGEIYLRLKPYLVVKISSDIVTEHCCQVCVLSMMFCRSAAVCWHGKCMSDCAISRLLIRIAENHVVWLNNSGRPTWDIRVFFTFDFHILH